MRQLNLYTVAIGRGLHYDSPERYLGDSLAVNKVLLSQCWFPTSKTMVMMVVLARLNPEVPLGAVDDP